MEQSEEDEQKAIEATKKLTQQIDAKHAEEADELKESISDFIDTFIDRKTSLQVAINAEALSEANKEVQGKIIDLLIGKELFESKVKEQAEKIIAEAKASANKEINEAIEANKKATELEDKLNKTVAEVNKLKAQKLLAEKTAFLRPSLAKRICEALEDKSIEEIEKEFEEVQAEAEKEDADKRQALRQQVQKQRQQAVDKKLEQNEEPETDDEQDDKPITESVKDSFIKNIKTRIKR